MAELAAPTSDPSSSRPLRSWNVTAIAGLVACITPVTAGVHGYFEKERDVTLQTRRLEQELELETLRRTNEMRIAYLDRMRDPGQQRRVLSMARIAAVNATVQAWADDELTRVDAELTVLREALTKREEEAELAWQLALQASDPRQRAVVLLEVARRKSDGADRLAAEIGQWHGRATND